MAALKGVGAKFSQAFRQRNFLQFIVEGKGLAANLCQTDRKRKRMEIPTEDKGIVGYGGYAVAQNDLLNGVGMGPPGIGIQSYGR